MPTTTARGRSSSSWACEQLRAALDRGDLLPGEQVRQEFWANELGVSRVAVREALPALAAEGRLDHHPNRGYFVRRPRGSEMAQIFLMRRLIEPEIIETVRWPDGTQLEQLQTSCAAATDSASGGDLAGALDHSRAFIFAMWDLSPLTLVVAEAKRLWSLSEPPLLAMSSHPFARAELVRAFKTRLPKVLVALASHDRTGLVHQTLADLADVLALPEPGSEPLGTA